MSIKLTITIATISKRKELFEELILQLNQQMKYYSLQEEVEILFDDDDDRFLGTKRRLMLEKAKGLFICAIDDDDIVSDKYLPLILSAIKKDETVDCIGINGVITVNDQDKRQWYISCEYKDWFEDNSIYYRTPNHICPIRTDLAKLANFDDVKWGEDYPFSQRVKQHLHRETKVSEPIYWYRYDTEKSLSKYQEEKK
jgi:hypothetical protein